MLRTETFATALRAAIDASGLGLARVSAHLASRGAPVSISTLSNWQRGIGGPRADLAQGAVPVLEEVLGLEPGRLSALLPQRSVRGSRHGGRQSDAAQRLTARLLSVHDELSVRADPPHWTLHSRRVLRAVRADSPEGAEQLAVRPGLLPATGVPEGLQEGGTWTVETRTEDNARLTEHGRRFHHVGVRYELALRLDAALALPAAPPDEPSDTPATALADTAPAPLGTVEQIVRHGLADPTSPVRRLPLLPAAGPGDGPTATDRAATDPAPGEPPATEPAAAEPAPAEPAAAAHLLLESAPPGFHGLRWRADAP